MGRERRWADAGRANWAGRQYHYQVGRVRTQAGPVAQIGTGVEGVRSSWEHQLEPSAGVSSPLASGTRDDDDSVVPWTWLDFHRHHLRDYVGEPFRLYALASDAWAAFEDEYVLDELDAFAPTRGEPEVDAWWTVALSVADYVVSL